MKERRSLLEGLKSEGEVQQIEEAFVFGAKPKNEDLVATEVVPKSPERKILPHMKGRIPLTTRVRPEVAQALKHASLRRQLDGLEPHFVQDIMEASLERWLSEHGYEV